MPCLPYHPAPLVPPCGHCWQLSLWSLEVKFFFVFLGVNSCLIFGCLVFCAWHALLPLSSIPWVRKWPPGPQALCPCELLGHTVQPLSRGRFLPSWAGLPPPLLICLFRWSRSSVASWEVCREIGFWNLTDLELSLFCTPFIFLLYF